MRVLVLCIVVALSLATHGIEANLCLSQAEFPADTYKSFILDLRQQLSFEANHLYGIPVLDHSVSNSRRFHFIHLTNANDETIILAIDVEDAGVVAYQAGSESYFFPNAPQVAFQILFSNTNRNLLNFNNTFQSIEKAANTTRLETLLGVDALESAISNLFQYRRKFVPVSLLVVIQMVIEASKYKFIEQSITNSIRDRYNFTPGLAIVSLENNWSELSLQIQASMSLQGLFGSVIELYNSNNELIGVDSIYYPIIVANIALQQYHCQVNIRDGIVVMRNYIKMPGIGDDARSNDPCYVEARTTRISGREGFCADVAGELSADGSRLILYPCGQQANQKWTFHSDQTIRSLGKCLTTNTSSFGNSLVIYNCDKATRKDITWDVSISGTIMNPSSNLVLTANKGTRSTNLTVEANTYAASQGWRVGDYVEPIITSIIGLKEMCLEATENNTNMWLEECVMNKMEQSWALYSDGTIRVNNNRSLCVTSSLNSSSKVITILSCNGLVNQRWQFMADGIILNPKTEMVMDVAQENIYLKKIILHPQNGKANQQWVVFY